MEKNKNKNLTSFLIYLTSILTFFLLGVFCSDKIELLYVKYFFKTNINNNKSINNNGNINNEIIYDYLFNTFKEDKNNYYISDDSNYSDDSLDLNLAKFWDIYSIIKLEYYSLEGIKKADLIDGAIKGIVDSLGDKHSQFMTYDETKKFNEVLNGDFEGIGAVVDKTDFGIKIEMLIKGSPALKSGILKDDIIIEANGTSLVDLDLYDAVEKIKGPAGTKVLLKIIRAGETGILEIEVTREKIKIPSVETKEFEGFNDIGYIALNMYGFDSSKEFKDALENYKDKKGIIIDLRDNGGGLLNSAVEILSLFIEKDKTLVTTKYKDARKNEVYTSFNDGIYEGKIVVLINGNSASASEITAGALKDYNKAILVGEKTYGKGSVQEPFSLVDRSSLKLTIAKWFTPNDNNIDGEGIKPDIEVKFLKEDYKNKYDRQLEIAKNVLNDFISKELIGLTVEKYNKDLIHSGSTDTGSLLE